MVWSTPLESLSVYTKIRSKFNKPIKKIINGEIETSRSLHVLDRKPKFWEKLKGIKPFSWLQSKANPHYKAKHAMGHNTTHLQAHHAYRPPTSIWSLEKWTSHDSCDLPNIGSKCTEGPSFLEFERYSFIRYCNLIELIILMKLVIME